MLKWRKMDPESMKGKIWLQVWDKIILGAIIAVAFVVYDQLKVAEERRYDDAVVFEFQRAGYVKELVPIVTSRDDLVVRTHALIKLIETKSISDSAAVALAERLLEEAAITSENLEEIRRDSFEPLQEVMSRRMAFALQPILQQYYGSSLGDRSSLTKNQDEVSRFWTSLFYLFVQQHNDSELLDLDKADFLNRNIEVLGRLAFLASPQWIVRRPKGLRILGALRLAKSGDAKQRNAALGYLVGAIDPPKASSADLWLAGRVTGLLKSRGIASLDLASHCIAAVLSDDIETYSFQRDSAEDYLEWWASSTPSPLRENAESSASDGWQDLEPLATDALMKYAYEAQGNRHNLHGDLRFLVDIVLRGLVTGEKPSQRTFRALSDVFHLPDPQNALGLAGLRVYWLRLLK